MLPLFSIIKPWTNEYINYTLNCLLTNFRVKIVCKTNIYIHIDQFLYMFLLIRFGELTYILMLSKLIENILLLWAQEGKTEEMICNIAAFVQFVSVTSALSYPFHFGKYTNNTRVDLIYFQKITLTIKYVCFMRV